MLYTSFKALAADGGSQYSYRYFRNHAKVYALAGKLSIPENKRKIRFFPVVPKPLLALDASGKE